MLQQFPLVTITKTYSFLIEIILSKHVLGGCKGGRRDNLKILDIPGLSKAWWPGTLATVMSRAAAKRLILEDVWGVGM